MVIFCWDLQTPGQVLPCGGKPLPRRHHLDPRAGNLSKRPTRTRRWCCHRQQCAWEKFFSLQKILFNLISPFPLYWGVGSHPLASLSKQLQNLGKDTGKEHLPKCITEMGLVRGTSETIYQSNGKKHELEDTSNFGGAGYVSISDWKGLCDKYI